jgi:cell pole-organizing protein PopZ
MAQQGEPSVEDILASIKKVIARDSREPAELPRRIEREAIESEESDDDQDAILDLAEEAELVEEAPLVTEQARLSMRESLAALSVMAQPGASPQIVRSGETSLEGMVRDLLRPALSEWLDKNLPPLVEQMVAAEIARIVGKKV